MAPRVGTIVGGRAPHHGGERIASTIDDDAAALPPRIRRESVS